MKSKCNKCGKGNKSLTKEGLCAFCHYRQYGTWSKRWIDVGSKHSDGEN